MHCVCVAIVLAVQGIMGCAAQAVAGDVDALARLESTWLATRIDVSLLDLNTVCQLILEPPAPGGSQSVAGGAATQTYLAVQNKVHSTKSKRPTQKMQQIEGEYVKLGDVSVKDHYTTEVFVSTSLNSFVVKHSPGAEASSTTFMPPSNATAIDKKTTWHIFSRIEEYTSSRYRGSVDSWFSSEGAVNRGLWQSVSADATDVKPLEFSCRLSKTKLSRHHAQRIETVAPEFVNHQCDSARSYVDKRRKNQQNRGPTSFDWFVDAVCQIHREYLFDPSQQYFRDNEDISGDAIIQMDELLAELHCMNYQYHLAAMCYFRGFRHHLAQNRPWPPPVSDESPLLNAIEQFLESIAMARHHEDLRDARTWLITFNTSLVAPPRDSAWANRLVLLEAVTAFQLGNYKDAVSLMLDLTPKVKFDFTATFVLEGFLRTWEDAASNGALPAPEHAILTNVKRQLASSAQRYSQLQGQFKSDYTGFSIPLEPYNNIGTCEEEENECTDDDSNGRSGGLPRISSWQPDRLDHIPTREEFEEYKRQRKPFIVSVNNTDDVSCPPTLVGLGLESACQWDAEYLCNRVPNERVWLHAPINRTLEGAPQFGVAWKPSLRQYTPFCDFVHECFDSDDGSQPVSERYFDLGSTVSSDVWRFPLNVLRNELSYPSFLEPRDVVTVALWMGAALNSSPSNSGLHYDNLDNFHVVTHGRKHWKIFSPNDAGRMDYIQPPQQVTDQGYILNIDEVDTKFNASAHNAKHILATWDRRGLIGRFSRRGRAFDTLHQHEGANPDFKEATVAEFDLNTGEGLFLPAGWAHEVESAGTHIAVTYWGRPDDGQFTADAVSKHKKIAVTNSKLSKRAKILQSRA